MKRAAVRWSLSLCMLVGSLSSAAWGQNPSANSTAKKAEIVYVPIRQIQHVEPAPASESVPLVYSNCGGNCGAGANSGANAGGPYRTTGVGSRLYRLNPNEPAPHLGPIRRLYNQGGFCCQSSIYDYGCGNFFSGFRFAFGSCRTFFGERCNPIPPLPHGR